MKLLRFVLAATFALAMAVPAAAQRYTAKQDGDVIEKGDQSNAHEKWPFDCQIRCGVRGSSTSVLEYWMTLAADCASVSRRWTPVAFPATMVCRGNAYGGCDENDSEEGGQKGTRAKTAKATATTRVTVRRTAKAS